MIDVSLVGIRRCVEINLSSALLHVFQCVLFRNKASMIPRASHTYVGSKALDTPHVCEKDTSSMASPRPSSRHEKLSTDYVTCDSILKNFPPTK